MNRRMVWAVHEKLYSIPEELFGERSLQLAVFIFSPRSIAKIFFAELQKDLYTPERGMIKDLRIAAFID